MAKGSVASPDAGGRVAARQVWRGVLVALAVLALAGCSVRDVAVRSLGKAMAEGGDVYASDDDPELVRDALPFALKTTEMLLAQQPDNRDLLLAAGQGFTQYAYGFVQLDAMLEEDWERSQELEARALKLYLRGRDYALRGLETAHPGIGAELRREPAAAAARLEAGDVPLAYWSALGWGAAIGLGKDRPELLAEIGAVRALLDRVAALDDAYDRGGVHEALMRFEAASPYVPGAIDRAQEHFERAVEISGGAKASPFVGYAEAIAIPTQDRERFDSMLARALAIDPDAVPELRLANLLVQRRARWLQEHVEDYFLPADDEVVPPDEEPMEDPS